MSEQALSTQNSPNALAALLGQEVQLEGSKYGDKKTLTTMSSGGFLPRIQLCGSNSLLCKRGTVGIGRFVVTNQKDAILHDLTQSFICMALSWRPKAMRFDGSNTKAFYVPDSPIFQTIQAEAGRKLQGSLYGPEFLVYLPDQNVFTTFFFMNPTMRRVSQDLTGLIGQWANIKSVLIEKPPHSWHGPEITESKTPPATLPAAGSEELLNFQSTMKTHLEKFNKPPESEVEAAPEEAAGTNERPR